MESFGSCPPGTLRAGFRAAEPPLVPFLESIVLSPKPAPELSGALGNSPGLAVELARNRPPDRPVNRLGAGPGPAFSGPRRPSWARFPRYSHHLVRWWAFPFLFFFFLIILIILSSIFKDHFFFWLFFYLIMHYILFLFVTVTHEILIECRLLNIYLFLTWSHRCVLCEHWKWLKRKRKQ